MIRVDRVQTIAFETEDGQQFKTESEAVAHGAKCALSRWFYDRGICCGGEWSADMVEQEIIDGAKELVEILEPLANLKS